MCCSAKIRGSGVSQVTHLPLPDCGVLLLVIRYLHQPPQSWGEEALGSPWHDWSFSEPEELCSALGSASGAMQLSALLWSCCDRAAEAGRGFLCLH